MATNAQRQAAYRARHREAGGGRINMAVTAQAEFALRRLARHYCVTQRAMLERLIGEAESEVTGKLSGADYRLYVRD
jgi:hypothetical protein